MVMVNRNSHVFNYALTLFEFPLPKVHVICARSDAQLVIPSGNKVGETKSDLVVLSLS